MTGVSAPRIVLSALLVAVAASACSKPAPPPAPQPAPADSTALRARTDSLAAMARRDSLARAGRTDSLARVRSDSIARAVSNARADSVRAQILRDSADAAPRTPSGLDSTGNAALIQAMYFETDRFDLTADAQRLLDRKIALLSANPRLQVQIEGHCDDRGPDEYNLALGNRRAAAVKRYLVEHGIADARVTIVSYGEERPAAPGAGEEAWARNRRAEFVVTRSAR
jgi:peptidoglycan-associated lipoprotein